jgi:hypothetical protein
MYLIRMKHGPAQKMRDTARPGSKDALKDPMRDVPSDDFAAFENLPKGLPKDGNAVVEVHAVSGEKEAKALRDSLIGSVKSDAAKAEAYRAKVKEKIARQTGRAKPIDPPKPSEKSKAIEQRIDKQTESTAEERDAVAAKLRKKALAEAAKNAPAPKKKGKG